MSGLRLLRSVWRSAVIGAHVSRTYGPASCTGLLHTSLRPRVPCRAVHVTPKLSNVKDTAQPVEEELGPFTKLIEALGFTGPLKYNKWVFWFTLMKMGVVWCNGNVSAGKMEHCSHAVQDSQKIKIAALRMYTCCVERIDYDDLFERCNLSDTLNSWFLVAQLHVWMTLVRMKQEGREGKFMCKYIVHSMWEDLEQRGKVMGIESVVLKENISVMTENFYAAIFGYDEGILSDDHVLAASLWRHLFNKQCEDPGQLELMVEYVRKQIQYLDSLSGEDLLLTGEVKWRPLLEDNPQSIVKPISPAYNDEGL
ncbi:ubiquinol-cytochrome-c reductase complex assembly factor 1 isoform X1 [Carcharodon carcharias]|uniref:ubiquinol-cytochrome-c reductase complex assembly factor 1 isoform X1 n=1 Tax=Carcharodon carcharias TaxID=13397 RepID=UPI001B7F209F|nr:ubiquinol-cytochrome-c reductase complex assembly factor 1 isoform X1 [Carcharodon carcharias]